MRSALILGYGYTGRMLDRFLCQHHPGITVVRTSRQPGTDVIFDLNEPGTWPGLPSVDATFWTLPAEPAEAVAPLLAAYRDRLGKLIAIGSTSAFVTHEPGEWVNEDTPRDSSRERVKGENAILTSGGMVVYASGIYGPQRNPVDWLREGRVSSSQKYLNLIHVEDLAQILIAAYEGGQPGAVYIASDSAPYTGQQLFDLWRDRYNLSSQRHAVTTPGTSKRVDAQRTLHALAVTLQFADVHQGVAMLEK